MKKSMKQVSLLFALCAFGLFSCDDEIDATKISKTIVTGIANQDGGNFAFTAIDTTITVSDLDLETYASTLSGTDVFSVGYSETQNAIAITKNNVIQFTFDAEYIISINDIAVNGNSVYVVGRKQTSTVNGSNYVATLRTNGESSSLSLKDSDATDITIDGNDVYIAGYDLQDNSEYADAVYWKNGTKNVLPAPAPKADCGLCKNNQTQETLFSGYASAIKIDGNNIYVVGGAQNEGGIIVWENNTGNWIGTNNASVSNKGLAINNGTVYVLGRDVNTENSIVGGVFTNGVFQEFNFAQGTAIVYHNGSVYVLGNQPGSRDTRKEIGNSKLFVGKSVLFKDGELQYTFPTGHQAIGLMVADF